MGTKPPLEILPTFEVEELLARLESRTLRETDYGVLLELVQLVEQLQAELATKQTTIARLRQMVFGSRSEKRKVVEPETENGSVAATAEPEVVPAGAALSAPEPEPAADSTVVSLAAKRRKGHGRLGAAAYSGAQVVTCAHNLKLHDPCPDPLCPGRLYDTKVPQLLIRLEGRPPIDATKFELPTYRCSACQERFAAPLPAEIPPEKYDPSADVIMVLLKYGASVPFHRLERLQGMLGIPLPASTQFARCEGVADAVLPIYVELQKQAAAGDTWLVDDTWQRILACLRENQTRSGKERTGTFTTGVVARVQGREIVLYFSGRRHAGENLTVLHQRRPAGLPLPLVMADAAGRNWSTDFEQVICKCLAHGRRQFVDISAHFPAACQRVLDDLATVYRVEAETKGMTPADRLAHHQKKSQPVLKALKQWAEAELETRSVEPNSGLGQALRYLLKHFENLTQFLRFAGAPLDNNACERILRPVVLQRKNALFFKTEHGAAIHDVLASVLHSCAGNQVNPFHYLLAVMHHPKAVRQRPGDWLPWNYQEQLRQKAA